MTLTALNVPQTATMGQVSAPFAPASAAGGAGSGNYRLRAVEFHPGPVRLGLDVVLNTLLHPELADSGMRMIVWDIRLLYVLMAVAEGLLLDWPSRKCRLSSITLSLATLP